jgi:hypothetical protein
MSGRLVYSRAVVVVGLAGVLLSGCNMSEPSVVGTLPHVEPDLTDLQRTEFPDECLVGNWTVSTADLDMFLVGLVQMIALHVTDGTVYVDFTWDGNYVYASDGFVLRIDLGAEQYLLGTAAFRTSGIYTTESGSLVLHDSGSVKQVTEWKAVKNGVGVVAPGAGPEISLVPNGPVPYECGPEELVLDWAGPHGVSPMIFTRPGQMP